MEYLAIKQIAAKWDNMTHTVLSLEELSISKIQNLFKETYRVFTLYHKDELIPKEISRIFLFMEEFLYFTSLMEEKEKGKGYYHWEEFNYIVNSLKKGFFDAKYDYDFPKLKITDILDNDYLVDFEKDDLKGYISAVQNVKAEEI